jgi:hypothetical protein
MSREEKEKFPEPIAPVFLEEPKLRQLAVELAKDIVEPLDVLKAVGITVEEYEVIKHTRAFKAMHNAALAEWHSAGNTQKRVKFKSAGLIEEVLGVFYQDIKNRDEPLSSRVELLKTIARFGGIGNPDPVTPGGNGQFFKLEIHLAGHKEPIVVGSRGPVIEGELTESPLAKEEPYDEF